SFLLAGVVPYLEEECLGYGFVRKRLKLGKTPELERSVLFVRATNDLPSQLAQRLFDYCAEPLTLERTTPTGRRRVGDLPDVLTAGLKAKPAGGRALRDAFEKDPRLLGKLLAALSDRLPYGLVLIVDQGEEVFTLARGRQDEANGELGL